MKFCDFLNILYNNSSHKPSKSQYILELFSALCGEENPFAANKRYPFSDALPEGLRGDDSGYRNRLYNGNNPKYDGLSRSIKKHIRENKNKGTFIAYLDESISENNMANLRTAFGVPNTVDKTKIFEMIYAGFVEYALNKEDSATLKNTKQHNVKSGVHPKDDRPFEEIFNDTIREFGVESFLESDPTELLESRFFEDMERFVYIICENYKDKNTLHKDEKTSLKMFEFSNTLIEYVEYLEKQMNLVCAEKVKNTSYMPEVYRAKYEPPKDNKDFESHTLNYRNSLKSLYNEIQSLQQE